MGIVVVDAVDIELPDQISGPPGGWRFALMDVPMLASLVGNLGITYHPSTSELKTE